METTENVRPNDCKDKHDDDKCKERDKCKDYEKCYEKCKEREKCKDYDKCKERDKGKDRRHDQPSHHIHELEKTIQAVADSLAHLGRGAHLQELLRIIRWPGWTTPAELAFVNTILDHISVEVRTIDRLQADLVEASRKVGHKHK